MSFSPPLFPDSLEYSALGPIPKGWACSTVGDVNMTIDRCSIGRGVAAARHKSISISCTCYAFRSLGDRFEVDNGEGTVFGGISQKDLRAIPWLATDDAVVSRFDQMVGPVDQRTEINEVQNRRLAGLRGTLLPKLLSGKIQLPAAEAVARRWRDVMAGLTSESLRQWPEALRLE